MTPQRTLDAETKRTEFETVAVPFMGVLYNGALRLTRDASDAADLVQEAYLRAYRTYENFEPGTNCKAWLFTILYSVFVNKYRRDQHRPIPVPPEELERRFESFVAGPAEAVAAAETVDAWGSKVAPEVETALSALPDDFRAAVVLVDLQGLSYEEAASALRCPVGTVRSRLYRARKLLFGALEQYAEQAGFKGGSP